MNIVKSLAAGLCLLVLTVTTGMLCSRPRDGRSVGPVQLAGMVTTPAFERAASTGLFVGVRTFTNDNTLTIPYAVDDAVDLAHRFALDQRVGLVPPRRVVVAISGTPQKDDSKQRLEELKDAGATIIHRATAGDILHQLEEQAALAGTNGLLVLAIASHGFQRNGDGYILGSTSTFDAPATALRTATLLDVAGRVPRSLVFIDACRDRVDPSTRGGSPDPIAGAPHIRRMARVRGQVVFYAAAPGQYAFDDDVSRNGVFTRAVLDGLNCEASAPRGTVLAETLHTYVDREVARWIRNNRNVTASPATQVSMEGETRNMPLSECWRSAGPKIRLVVDGSVVKAYDAETNPLWRKEFDSPVVRAERADLDADAFDEAVVGLRDRIVVLDRDGKPLWTRTMEDMTLRTFAIGDLYEKKTNQIIALWNDEHAPASRLTILDDRGADRGSRDDLGDLHHVAIGRPTKMHAPKIVVATSSILFLLNPKKLTQRVRPWPQMVRPPAAVDELFIRDANDDRRDDIGVVLRGGAETWFTFDGRIVRQNPKVTWSGMVARR